MAIQGYAFTMALRVRWAEVDQQGIVFNAHYLTYFDVAITEYWRAIGLPSPDGLAGTGSDLYSAFWRRRAGARRVRLPWSGTRQVELDRRERRQHAAPARLV
jgi:hypothetical protein